MNWLKSVNLSRFVLATVLAVFVWAYVSLTVYPEQTNTFEGIHLDIRQPQNTELIVREVQNSEPFTVSISGPRDKLTGITSSSLRPYVDLSRLDRPTTDQFRVELKVPDGVRYSIKPERVEIQVEQKKVETIKVTVQTIGEVSADYSISNVKVNPEYIEINGPASQVSQVEKAVARVDISNRNISLVARISNVQLLGANDQELKLEQVQIKPESVTVDVRVNPNFNNRDVAIRVTTKGEPALGYVVGSSTLEPQFVTVYGEPTVISQLNFIETEPVDVSGASNNITTEVALKQPRDVLITQENKKAKVTIVILPLDFSTTLEYAVQQTGIGAGLRWESQPARVTITLSGPYRVFQELQRNQFKLEEVRVEIDLNGKGPGTYNNLPLKISAPAGLQVLNPPNVTVRVVAIPTPTPLPTFTPVPPTATPTLLPPSPTPTQTIPTEAAATPLQLPVTPIPTTR